MFKILVVIFFLAHLPNSLSVRVCRTFMDYYFPKSKNCWNNPDADLNITEIVERWGFNADEYNLTTPDGYQILVVNAYSTKTKKTPIILGAGTFANTLIYMSTGNKSITHILLKLGYKVWLVNWRGTRYSRGHVNLTVADPEYWHFSFYEQAVYDLQTAINFIYEKSQEKAIYISWSQGTTVGFIYSIMNPDMAKEKIKGMTLLAPLVYYKNIPSLFRLMPNFKNLMKKFVYKFWHGEIAPRSFFWGQFCVPQPVNFILCETVRASLYGYDYGGIDPVTSPVTQLLNPDSKPMDVLLNDMQTIETDEFKSLDYGNEINLKKYGQENPITYNLSKVSVPVILYLSENDFVSTLENAKRFYAELPDASRCGLYIVNNTRWNHEDFIKAKDIVEVLNKRLVQSIAQLENGTCNKNITLQN